MKLGSIIAYGVIYKITNLINKKVYIGQTTDVKGFDGRYECKGIGVERVYNYHKNKRDNYEYYNYHLLSSIEKYGFDNFKVEKIIDIAFSKKELDIKEMCWISIYKSWNREFGYNTELGGSKRSRVGRRIICVNNNMRFISYNQAIEYFKQFNIYLTKDYIKDTMKIKFKNNTDKLIFRLDSDKMNGKIFCENCGRPVKKFIESQKYCPKCSKILL